MIAVLVGETLHAANVGDSRVVIGKKTAAGLKAEPLTFDHKPDTPAEQESVRRRVCGGE